MENTRARAFPKNCISMKLLLVVGFVKLDSIWFVTLRIIFTVFGNVKPKDADFAICSS